MENNYYAETLRRIREKYSANPGGLYLPDSQLPFKPHDALYEIPKNFAKLQAFGRITWGQVLQANEHLYVPGDLDLPFAMVFSDHPLTDSSPDILIRIARDFVQYKPQNIPKKNIPYPMREGVYGLRDEFSRQTLYIDLRSSGMYPVNVHFSTLIGYRTHLPNGVINSQLYPMIYLPYKPNIAMILPKEYYTDENGELMTF